VSFSFWRSNNEGIRSPEKQSIQWMLCPGREAQRRIAAQHGMQAARRQAENPYLSKTLGCHSLFGLWVEGIRSPEKQSIRWMLCPGRGAQRRIAAQHGMQAARRQAKNPRLSKNLGCHSLFGGAIMRGFEARKSKASGGCFARAGERSGA